MKRLFRFMLGMAVAFSLWGNALAAEPNYRSGTPWPDTDLDGVVTEDMEASIKDNFVLAVNKEDILAIKIPEGYPCGGTMTDLQLKRVEDLKNMFLGKEPAGHDQKLAYRLFQLMMDWESRNAQGVLPLKKQTEAIESVNTISDLNAHFLESAPEDCDAILWPAASGADSKDSSRNILQIAYAPLLLGDSAEYGKLTEYGVIKQKAFSDLAQKMLEKLGYSEMESRQKIENCFALESKMASAIYTNEERNKPDFVARANNYYSREKLAKEQGNLPILATLKHLGYPEAREYVVWSPAFLSKMNQLYTQENLPLLKDYLIVHEVLSSADNLDRECYEWSVECGNAISGAHGMLPDADVFSSRVANTLEWPTARFYAETYLKQEDKKRISGLVDRLFDA